MQNQSHATRRDGTEMDCRNVTNAVEHKVVGPGLDIQHSSFPNEVVPTPPSMQLPPASYCSEYEMAELM